MVVTDRGRHLRRQRRLADQLLAGDRVRAHSVDRLRRGDAVMERRIRIEAQRSDVMDEGDRP
jgi:hypothetical protein